jgi:hypothetical protein
MAVIFSLLQFFTSSTWIPEDHGTQNCE